MYTELEGILSACLLFYVSFSLRALDFADIFFPPNYLTIQCVCCTL
jgi:hypothetical protein